MGRSEPSGTWAGEEEGSLVPPPPIPLAPSCLPSPCASPATPAWTRYCGERAQFVVAGNSNKLTVHFHSDQSYTDAGFLAEYVSYDSLDREWIMPGSEGLGRVPVGTQHLFCILNAWHCVILRSQGI